MNIALELLKFFPVISVLSRNGRGEGMGEGVGRREWGRYLESKKGLGRYFESKKGLGEVF